MIPVTSDAVAQAQLDICLRAAQEKIIRENKEARERFERHLVSAIHDRMKSLRVKQ